MSSDTAESRAAETFVLKTSKLGRLGALRWT